MSTATLPMYEWKTVPWSKLQKNVFKLVEASGPVGIPL